VGWDIGLYSTFGGGAFIGGGAGGGLEIVYTPSVKTIEEVKGESLDITLEGALPIVRGGLGVSIPVIEETGEPDPDWHNYGVILNPIVGGGEEAGVMIIMSKTNAISFSEIISKLQERMSWLTEIAPPNHPDSYYPQK
jgi:hypothetical protein